MFMSAYVYVLRSLRNGRYYIGSTDNLLRRYHHHQAGHVHTTARMLPVMVEGWKQFDSLLEARQSERSLKKNKSRASVEQWLAESQTTDDRSRVEQLRKLAE